MLGASILLETQKILSNKYADLEVIVAHREKVGIAKKKTILFLKKFSHLPFEL
jgi:hypothetical protein